MIFKAFARHIISLKKKNDCVKDLGSKRQVNRKILLWGIGNQEEIVQAQNGLLGRLQDFLRKIAIAIFKKLSLVQTHELPPRGCETANKKGTSVRESKDTPGRAPRQQTRYKIAFQKHSTPLLKVKNLF